MQILIKNQAIFRPGSSVDLRSGVISALSTLEAEGHSLLVDSTLPNSVKTVLSNEGIRLSELNDEEPDMIIGTSHTAEELTCSRKGEIIETESEWTRLSGLIIPSKSRPKQKARTADINRKTSETNVMVRLNLDGSGNHHIETGLGFFDHMLEQIARHGHVDLDLKCSGDLHIDEHHTIEDCGLALGEAISKALGDKRGIERYASVLPMDESRAMVALDLSGRPYLVFEGSFTRDKIGDVPAEMIKHFFHSLAMTMKATLHIEFKGENAHHQAEAIFKGFARVLREAVRQTGGDRIPSSKGVL